MVLRITTACLYLWLVPVLASGQVKHNFEKGPENTDCHLISGNFDNVQEYVADVRKRTYRFTQELRISAYRSPRSLEYYSCDGKSGFVVAVMDENTYHLHTKIPKDVWDQLLDRTDILEYYGAEFSASYPAWKPIE